MKKYFKQFVLLLCTLLLAVGIGVTATACGGNDPDPVTYTVRIILNAGGSAEEEAEILSTLKVQLLKEDGTAATDETAVTNNQVTFSLAPATYTVRVTSDYAGSLYYADTVLTAEQRIQTVRLTATPPQETVTYSATIKYPNGGIVAGILVDFCVYGDLGTCTSVRTNENGVATVDLPSNTYEVHISTPPQGYKAIKEPSPYLLYEEGGSAEIILELE